MVPATSPKASDGTSVTTSISGMRPCITGEPGPVSEPSAARMGEAAGATTQAKAAASATATADATQSAVALPGRQRRSGGHEGRVAVHRHAAQARLDDAIDQPPGHRHDHHRRGDARASSCSAD